MSLHTEICGYIDANTDFFLLTADLPRHKHTTHTDS